MPSLRRIVTGWKTACSGSEGSAAKPIRRSEMGFDRPANGTRVGPLLSLDRWPVILSLPSFDVGNRPGSYDSCGLSNRLDYIFISQSLRQFYMSGGLFRKGLWGSRASRPTDWQTYPQMTRSIEQASDHSAAFVELNL